MRFVKNVANFVVKHKRTILTVVSIGSMAYGVYRAYKDGPEFKRLIDKLEEEEASLGTKIKTLAPVVAPTAAAVIVSAASTVANQVCATKEIKELSGDLAQVTSVLAITQSSKELIEKKAREMLGDEVVDNVNREVMLEKARKHFDAVDGYDDAGSPKQTLVLESNKIIDTGIGDQLFYLDWLDVYFKSDINDIKAGVNNINEQYISDMSVSLSELLLAWHLPSDLGTKHRRDPSCPNTNDFWGWRDPGEGLIRMDYYSGLDEYDRSFTGISFRNEPRSHYTDIHPW